MVALAVGFALESERERVFGFLYRTDPICSTETLDWPPVTACFFQVHCGLPCGRFLICTRPRPHNGICPV